MLLKNGVVRNYVTPVNPQTSSQMSNRAVFAAAVNAWRSGLTDAQRTAYETAASDPIWSVPDPFTGTLRKLTGETLFIQLYTNVELATGDGTGVYDVPAPIDMRDLVLTSFTADISDDAFNLDATGTPGGEVLIYATDAISAGRMRLPKNQLRLLYAGSFTFPSSFLSYWETVFHELSSADEGKKVFVKVDVVSKATGQRVTAGTASAIISA